MLLNAPDHKVHHAKCTLRIIESKHTITNFFSKFNHNPRLPNPQKKVPVLQISCYEENGRH